MLKRKYVHSRTRTANSRGDCPREVFLPVGSGACSGIWSGLPCRRRCFRGRRLGLMRSAVSPLGFSARWRRGSAGARVCGLRLPLGSAAALPHDIFARGACARIVRALVRIFALCCGEGNPRHRGGGIGLCLREVQRLGYTMETEEI